MACPIVEPIMLLITKWYQVPWFIFPFRKVFSWKYVMNTLSLYSLSISFGLLAKIIVSRQDHFSKSFPFFVIETILRSWFSISWTLFHFSAFSPIKKRISADIRLQERTLWVHISKRTTYNLSGKILLLSPILYDFLLLTTDIDILWTFRSK